MSFVMVIYLIGVFPKHVSVVYNYFMLKSKVSVLDLELKAIAGTLMSAKDIDTVIKNSGFNIKLCTIMESINSNSLRSYNGEELEGNEPRVVEYIIETKDDVNYILSYLSGYNISYSSILLSDQELFLKIYCN